MNHRIFPFLVLVSYVFLPSCNNTNVSSVLYEAKSSLTGAQNDNRLITMQQDDRFDNSICNIIDESISNIKLLDNAMGNVKILGFRDTDQGTEALMMQFDDKTNEEELLWKKMLRKESKCIVTSALLTRGDDLVISGNYRVLEAQENNACVLMLSQEGDEHWSADCGVDGYDTFRDITQMADGTFIAVGNIFDSIDDSKSKIYLVRISENGDIINSRVIEKEAQLNTNTILATQNGNILLLSIESEREISEKGTLNVYSYDTEFNEIWHKTFGEASIFSQIIEGYGNEYVVLTGSPMKITRIDSSGVVRSEITYDVKDDTQLFGITGHRIMKIGDDGFLTIGQGRRIVDADFQSTGVVVKLDKEGRVIWNRELAVENMTMISDVSYDASTNEYIFAGFYMDLADDTSRENIMFRLDNNGKPRK